MIRSATPSAAASLRFVLALLWLASATAGCARSSDARTSDSGAAGEDSAALQGRWELGTDNGPPAEAKQRVVKEVSGDSETVTTYDARGKTIHAQTAKFRLERRGGVPVYTFYDRRITAGPEQGKAQPGERSFVYRLRGDDFDEVWGLLPGQEQRQVSVNRWRRAGGAPSPR